MRWFNSIVLRLFLGSVVGLGITLFVSYYSLGSGGQASSALAIWLILLGPLVIITFAGFILPSLFMNARWKEKWLPLAEGKEKFDPDKSQKVIKKALRELTSVWMLPNASEKRVAEFIEKIAHTMLGLRFRQNWAWEIYALSWYKNKHDKEFVDDLRALVMDSEELSDEAYEVGLNILIESETDLELAILLSKEGLAKDFSNIEGDRLPLLENAWLAAYAKDDQLANYLRPRLVGLFIETKRRDAVSGRIYMDSFIDGDRYKTLFNEMTMVAEILERTGRNPEMTANLKALAKSALSNEQSNESNEYPDWRKPIKITNEEKNKIRSVREILEYPDEVPTERKKLARDISHAKKISAPEKKYENMPKSRWGIIVAIIAIIVIVAGSIYYLMNSGIVEQNSTEPTLQKKVNILSAPGEVRSQYPFTIQISALPTREAAVSELNILREKGIDAYYVITRRDEAEWYRIRFGEFQTTRNAQAIADSLRQVGLFQEYYIAAFEPGLIPKDVK